MLSYRGTINVDCPLQMAARCGTNKCMTFNELVLATEGLFVQILEVITKHLAYPTGNLRVLSIILENNSC